MTSTGTDRPAAERAPGLRIGAIAGVPVYLGRTWPVIVVVIVALFGPNLAASRPELGVRAYLLAFVFALLLLLSVLAHEAAHALVGRACGYRVVRVVADFWGGHTAYDSSDTTPGRSALVAIAGPTANAGLAGTGFLLLGLLSADIPVLMTTAFVYANAFVAVFNLLPGLPLDGGFLVDALVWRLTGSRERGMIAAGWAGRVLTILLAGWALLVPFAQGHRPSTVNVIWVVLLGSFLWMGASNAVRTGRARLLLSRITIGSVWRPAAEVPADTSVADALRLAARGGPGGVALVVRRVDPEMEQDQQVDPVQGVVGVVDGAALRQIPEHLWAVTPVSAVTQGRPRGWVVTAEPQDAITAVVATMQELHLASVAVRTGSGRVEGIVTVQDLHGRT